MKKLVEGNIFEFLEYKKVFFKNMLFMNFASNTNKCHENSAATEKLFLKLVLLGKTLQ